MVRIGAHDREGDPLTVASATGSEVVQFFLGDPQGWGAPTFPGGDAGKLRAALSEAGLEAFIHAPYGINVASANNRIRTPQPQTAEPAARRGGRHRRQGPHRARRSRHRRYRRKRGIRHWRKAIERIERPVPLLIENTAGGDHAMARGLPALQRLWDAIGDLSEGDGTGTARSASAWTPATRSPAVRTWPGIVDRVRAITGRIDLVHCNNSRDEFGSFRDRHAAIESGTIEPELLLDVVRAAGAPAVSETPDPAADIAWLRERLTG